MSVSNAQHLETFVANLHTITSRVGNADEPSTVNQLYEHLTKNWEVLEKNSQHLDNVLEGLDPQDHSLAVIAILIVKQTVLNDQNLFHYIDDFMNAANPIHLRAAPDLVYELCHNLIQPLLESGEAMAIRGIDLISRAIVKTQIHENQLLSLHVDLLQLCLASQCLKPALPFLAADITVISRENGNYNVKNFLLYYYYGGVIYGALKDYQRSHFFFEQAIVCPAAAVSQIIIDAFKKWILTSLIVAGRLSPLPKYAAHALNRLIKPMTSQYSQLAAAYVKNDLTEFNSLVDNFKWLFERDGNLGLVKQATGSLLKRNIQRLTKTFMTLSLTDMASRVGLASGGEAEKKVLNMIEDEEIFAEINEKDGMVRFLDNPEKYNNPFVLRKLEDEMRVLIQLDEKVREMDYEMAISPKFIQRSKESD